MSGRGLPPPNVDSPLSPKCNFCERSNVQRQPGELSGAALAALHLKTARETLREELRVRESFGSSNAPSEVKTRAGISPQLARAIATRSSKVLQFLQPFSSVFAENALDDQGRPLPAFEKLFRYLWDVQQTELPDKDQEAFFVQWLLEHVWLKWESHVDFKMPGLFDDVCNRVREEAMNQQYGGGPVTPNLIFVALVCRMADGIVAYFSGPPIDEAKERSEGSVDANEALPSRNERALDLLDAVNEMDAVPSLLFLLLLQGLLRIDSSTPHHYRVAVMETLSSCLAITLGPKCDSHTLTAFVSSFLQEAALIEKLLRVASEFPDLARPALFVLTAVIDILDDFNIINDDEAYNQLLERIWSSLPAQAQMVVQRCYNPVAFADIAFLAVQNGVSLLHIEEIRDLAGENMPDQYAQNMHNLVHALVHAFVKSFSFSVNQPGATPSHQTGMALASASKIYELITLCKDHIPERFAGNLSYAEQQLSGQWKWRWDYMQSSGKNVLYRVIDDPPLHECGDAISLSTGTFCHQCHKIPRRIKPKRVLGQHVITNPQTGGMRKVDIDNVDDWMRSMADALGVPDLLTTVTPGTPPMNSDKASIRSNHSGHGNVAGGKEPDKVKKLFGKIGNFLGGDKNKKNAAASEPQMSMMAGSEAVSAYENAGGRYMGGGALRTPIPINNATLELEMRMVDLENVNIDRVMEETAVALSRAFTAVEFGR
ncbi:hypothetical protein BJ742DRAFT_835192 [Cladochytrium replicatum]|nr:hypothetical protein BJ742DRAFT_835192 [Cladochytrium replicatum]